MNKLKNSFSLIEVLVFTSIMSVFFVMATAVVVTSLRNMRFNEHKIAASHYASQLQDWLAGQKEGDWPLFTTYATAVPSGLYCFNSALNATWALTSKTSGNCTLYAISGTYKRDLTLANVGGPPPYQVNATIRVSWLESGVDRFVETKTVFSVLE